jgi:ABC-type Fe3+-siderophore transport system permease subunit
LKGFFLLRGKTFIISLTLLIFMTLMVLISLLYGSVNVTLERIFEVILHDDGSKERTIIWDLRLPRSIIAILIGASLAVSGAMMQNLTKNPLAEPKIMGISAGAAAMVVIIEFFFVGLPYIWFSPLVFLGAAAGGILVFGLSFRGEISPLRLILAGVAVSAFLHAITVGVLILLGEDAIAVYSWLAGGLNGLSWNHMGLILPWSLIGITIAMILSSKMNLLDLGDDVARGLGLKVGIIKIILAVNVIILAGSSVSISGTIGFIGLIVPHLTRKLVGNDYRKVIPISALLGASILVAGDFLARIVADPIELPVGIFTAALGCPYFLYLVRKQGDERA